MTQKTLTTTEALRAVVENWDAKHSNLPWPLVGEKEPPEIADARKSLQFSETPCP